MRRHGLRPRPLAISPGDLHLVWHCPGAARQWQKDRQAGQHSLPPSLSEVPSPVLSRIRRLFHTLLQLGQSPLRQPTGSGQRPSRRRASGRFQMDPHHLCLLETPHPLGIITAQKNLTGPTQMSRSRGCRYLAIRLSGTKLLRENRALLEARKLLNRGRGRPRGRRRYALARPCAGLVAT